ncbi:hypothetical protein AAHE18_07G145800 [Arachis hypogaea]
MRGSISKSKYILKILKSWSHLDVDAIILWWSKETVAVVTGGNRGIGLEICRQLAAHGVTVILTSRDPGAGLESIKFLSEVGLSLIYHQLDILDLSSINRFIEWLKENYGGLDILVNNAGVNFNLGSDNSVENAHKVVETNYYGTKSMIEAMIPLMKPSVVGARIVNVSSRLGRLNGRRNRISNAALREQLSDVESLSEELINTALSTFLRQVDDGTWASGWVKTALTGYAGNNTVEEGADTGVWLALLSHQPITGKFFAERREINF